MIRRKGPLAPPSGGFDWVSQPWRDRRAHQTRARTGRTAHLGGGLWAASRAPIIAAWSRFSGCSSVTGSGTS